jgi:hypothetical protein
MFEDLEHFLFLPRSGNKLRDVYFESNYPTYYKQILDYTEHFVEMGFGQRFWHCFYQKKEKPKCPTCGTEIDSFITFLKGYRIYCNAQCQLLNPQFQIEQKQRNLAKYGVESTNSLEAVGKKRAIGWKAKEQQIRANTKATLLARYGVERLSDVPGAKEKTKATYLAKYGVDHNMKSIEGFTKQQKAAFKMRQYKNTKLTYQGSYELFFLEECGKVLGGRLDQIITNPLSIPYFWQGKMRHYFPDFLVSTFKLMVEIKSEWTLDRCGKDGDLLDKNIAKKNAVMEAGYYPQILMEKTAIQNWIMCFLRPLFEEHEHIVDFRSAYLAEE